MFVTKPCCKVKIQGSDFHIDPFRIPRQCAGQESGFRNVTDGIYELEIDCLLKDSEL